MEKETPIPLYVDLDGTLVRTDTLWEQCLDIVKKNPLNLFLLLSWVWKGKLIFKSRVANASSLRGDAYPYHSTFLPYLKEQQQRGRSLILCTASHKQTANHVAEHLNIFSDIISTDETRNVSGINKRDAVLKSCPAGAFDYAGNSAVDLAVWEKCRRPILVNASENIKKRVGKFSDDYEIFDDRKNPLTVFFKAIRVKQWVKNVLLFIPIIVGHQVLNKTAITSTLFYFFALSLVASSTYLLNDLWDLQNDRRHSSKKERPFASGDMQILTGLTLIPTLFIAGIGIAMGISSLAALFLLAYVLITFSYSLYLKRVLLMDVITLAMLYTFRILAGGAVSGIVISSWLLTFSLFLFTSLALVKRFSELFALPQDQGNALGGRGYLRPDLNQMCVMGTSCGIIAVLVLALYINSPEVKLLYKNIEILWFLCPLILYWIGRVWFITNRGFMEDDPIVFALKDPESYLTGAIAAICIFLGSL